jgi:transcriptional regulator with XRE-family HTH domain
MCRRKRRSNAELSALRGVQATLLREGQKARDARRRRRWTQRELGRRAHLAQTTISKLERGEGGSLSLATWQRVADALDMPLKIELGRDPREETRDAGHLAMQELVLRTGRKSGYARSFELATRPADPAAWVDAGLIDHKHRRLVLVECVNVIADIGSATRTSDRKVAEAEQLATALGHGHTFSVHSCWLIRATRRNRQLVARYPELFAARFPGSSRAWVATLTRGAPPPTGRGLIWCDVSAMRLFEWRRAG